MGMMQTTLIVTIKLFKILLRIILYIVKIIYDEDASHQHVKHFESKTRLASSPITLVHNSLNFGSEVSSVRCDDLTSRVGKDGRYDITSRVGKVGRYDITEESLGSTEVFNKTNVVPEQDNDAPRHMNHDVSLTSAYSLAADDQHSRSLSTYCEYDMADSLANNNLQEDFEGHVAENCEIQQHVKNYCDALKDIRMTPIRSMCGPFGWGSIASLSLYSRRAVGLLSQQGQSVDGLNLEESTRLPFEDDALRDNDDIVKLLQDIKQEQTENSRLKAYIEQIMSNVITKDEQLLEIN